jgi:hypothetical protein
LGHATISSKVSADKSGEKRSEEISEPDWTSVETGGLETLKTACLWEKYSPVEATKNKTAQTMSAEKAVTARSVIGGKRLD